MAIDVLEHEPPPRGPRPRQVALAAMVVVLLAAVAVLTVLVVHYRGKSGRPVSPLAAAPPTPLPTLSPTVSRGRFSLLHGRLHLEIVGVGPQSAGTGTLIITGLLTGGTPGRRYVLSGGDCTSQHDFHRPFASGVSDRGGTAYLTGPVRRLPAMHDYYMYLEPWPYRLGHAAQNGLYGSFVQADGFPLRDRQQPCL